MEDKISVNGITLANSNLISVRRWCLERTLDFMKGESDLKCCGVQDWKCQMIDCAKALSDFILSGTTAVSTVGKTPLLLPASRALLDRKVALTVAAFNELMSAKGFMRSPTSGTLIDSGLSYGENTTVQQGWGTPVTKPYYYDNKFDELLEILGIKVSTKKVEPTKESKRTIKAESRIKMKK